LNFKSGYGDNLRKWRELAGDSSANVLIIADYPEAVEMCGCQIVSWDSRFYL
jgi:hypothetical protein